MQCRTIGAGSALPVEEVMLHTLLSGLLVHNIHIIQQYPIHRLPTIQHVMRHIARILAIAHVLFDQKPAKCILPQLVHNRHHIAMTKVAVQSNIKRERPRTCPGLLCVPRGGAGVVGFAPSGKAPGTPRELAAEGQVRSPINPPPCSAKLPAQAVAFQWRAK